MNPQLKDHDMSDAEVTDDEVEIGVEVCKKIIAKYLKHVVSVNEFLTVHL